MSATDNQLAVVVLAAGKGTRMHSELPKVLHPLAGRPMIDWVADLAQELGAVKTVMVVGHRAELVREHLAGRPGLAFALQQPQRGTGHAVMAAAPELGGFTGQVLILYGDVPGLRRGTVRDLLERQRAQGDDLTVLALELDPPPAYGRLVLDGAGRLERIVEERDATPAQKAITLVNSGIYVFRGAPLWECLPLLDTDNDQSEYYLTDLVALFIEHGYQVGYALAPEPRELQGINSPEDLALLHERWAAAGGKGN